MKTWAKVILVSFIIFQLLDLITTLYALTTIPWLYEGNGFFGYVNAKTITSYILFSLHKLAIIGFLGIIAYAVIRLYEQIPLTKHRPIIKQIASLVTKVGLAVMLTQTIVVVLWNISNILSLV